MASKGRKSRPGKPATAFDEQMQIVKSLVVDRAKKLDFEKRHLLSLVTFGAHTYCQRLLRDLFSNEYGIKTFYIYEYFCTHPIVAGADAATQASQTSVYAPFLERVLAKREFVAPLNSLLKEVALDTSQRDIPAIASKINLVANQKSFIKNEWCQCVDVPSGSRIIRREVQQEILISQLQSTVLGHLIFQSWATRKAQEVHNDLFISNPMIINGSDKYKSMASMMGYINAKKATEGSYLNDVEKDFASWLAEYLLVVRPWHSTSDRRVGFLVASIASDALFFGHMFVLFPPIDGTDASIEPGAISSLMSAVQQTIFQKYLPCLTLFHNYWAEKTLDDFFVDQNQHQEDARKAALKALIKDNRQTFFFLARTAENSPSLTGSPVWRGIERPLHRLWLQRGWLIDPSATSPPSERPYKDMRIHPAFEMLRQSLVFRRYLVASPRMVACVQEAMKIHLDRQGTALACALVVGEAGSGKDQMSHIIKAFSADRYAFGPTNVLNMATLRPRTIVPPLLLGVHLFAAENSNNTVGWLVKLTRPTCGQNGWMSTLILDELNSLDVESQGALLRVLENAEVLPLGGEPKDKKEIDALIIGVMNEDPEKLTWQGTMQALRDAETLFGGVIGELAREYFIRLRRLRDDLYFRLVRGGKIVIPPLRERTEDIPILFYVYVKEELRKLDSAIEVYIDFDAYEYLMSPRFTWPGNIRELQMVAKKSVASATRNLGDDEIESLYSIRVSRNHISDAVGG